jgi:hypothetical protein
LGNRGVGRARHEHTTRHDHPQRTRPRAAA